MNEIYKLIPQVMADIGAVSKDRKNEKQNYAFRGIDQFLNAAHPALCKHGVFCAPEVVERTETRFDRTNDYNKVVTWIHVALKVCHRFYAPDGSFISVITVGEGLDQSDKASNKAMSAALKYALIGLFAVPTEDIEEADKSTPEIPAVQKPVTLRKAPAKLPEETGVYVGGKDVVHMDTAEVKAAIAKALGPPPETVTYITVQQAGVIARRFRESLREDLQPMAEELRHDALRVFDYIDKDMNPSALMIPVSEYEAAGKRLIAYAKGL